MDELLSVPKFLQPKGDFWIDETRRLGWESGVAVTNSFVQARWGLTCFAPLPAKQSCVTAGRTSKEINAETMLGLNCPSKQLHHGISNNYCDNYALFTCALQANRMIIALFCDDRRLIHP